MSSFFCRVWPYESLGDLSVNHMMQFFFPLTEASRMVSQHGWPDVPFYLTASTFCDLRGFEIAFSKSRNTASDSTITSLSIIERQLRRSYDAIFPRNVFPVPRVTRWPVLFYLVAVMSRCPFFFFSPGPDHFLGPTRIVKIIFFWIMARRILGHRSSDQRIFNPSVLRVSVSVKAA